MIGAEFPQGLRWRARGDDLRRAGQLLVLAADAADVDDRERAKDLLAAARVRLVTAARRLGIVAAPRREGAP